MQAAEISVTKPQGKQTFEYTYPRFTLFLSAEPNKPRGQLGPVVECILYLLERFFMLIDCVQLLLSQHS